MRRGLAALVIALAGLAVGAGPADAVQQHRPAGLRPCQMVLAGADHDVLIIRVHNPMSGCYWDACTVLHKRYDMTGQSWWIQYGHAHKGRHCDYAHIRYDKGL